MIAMRFGNLGFTLCRETWGFHFDINLRFPVGTKLDVSRRLNCDGGTRLGRYLEITNFVDVSRDKTDFRWGRM